MLQSGERAPSLAARITMHGRLKAALLRDELGAGSVELAQFSLLTLAALLQTVVLMSPGHFRPAGNAFFAFVVAFGTFGSLAAAFVAATASRSLSRPLRRHIGLAGLLVLGLLALVGAGRLVGGAPSLEQGPPYSNDGAVMDLYAATQVLHGHNPYFKTNIVAALAQIDAPATTTTPLMDGQFRGAQAYPSQAAIEQVFLNVLNHRSGKGLPIPPEFESKYNYPAGSFLFILPFVWAGLHDMRFLYFLAIVAMGVYLWRRSPPSLRFLVPFFVLANVPLLVLAIGGQPDPLYGLLLLIGYAEWRRPYLSPLAIGLAAGTKQVAWFFLPFYVLLIAREFGPREAVRRAGIVAASALVMNLPFILLSPSDYVTSIAGPMRDPMFPLGIGIVALFVAGVLPMLPKLAFTVAELAAWVGSIGASARYRLTPASGLVLGALPLFFAWRSLVNYFYLVPLLVLAAVLTERRA